MDPSAHGNFNSDEETEDVSHFMGSIASPDVADRFGAGRAAEEAKVEEGLAYEAGRAHAFQPTNTSGLHDELIESKRRQDGPVPPEFRRSGVAATTATPATRQFAGSSGQTPQATAMPDSVPVAVVEPYAEPYNDAAARLSGGAFAAHNSGGSLPPGAVASYAPSYGSGGSGPFTVQNSSSSVPPAVASAAIDGGRPVGVNSISSIPPAVPPQDHAPQTNNSKRPYLLYGSIALLALAIIAVAVAVPVSISSKDEPLDGAETQAGAPVTSSPTQTPPSRPPQPSLVPTTAPTVCPDELATVAECANEALTPNELDACLKCIADFIPNATTSCSEVETGLCEGFRRCECGTCADEIEEYLYCYDRTEIGCNFNCNPSPLCFETQEDLYVAVDQYLDNNASDTDLAQTYGWPINNWCVSQITNFSSVFSGIRNPLASSFDSALSDWDVSNAVDMSYMFRGASAFQQDLSGWNTAKVESMRSMFNSADSFFRSLNNWDTSSVTDMSFMFYHADTYNGEISALNTASVTDMESMFSRSSFNRDISMWNVGSAANMRNMFFQAEQFNQDLCSWGPQLSGRNVVVSNMFHFATSCGSQADPNFSSSPPGPFCANCTP